MKLNDLLDGRDVVDDNGGPGRQGGHMTVLEDYEIETEQFGVLEAGVTLDADTEQGAAKLAAALEPSSRLSGTSRPWRNVMLPPGY